jgi:hypothetical protein
MECETAKTSGAETDASDSGRRAPNVRRPGGGAPSQIDPLIEVGKTGQREKRALVGKTGQHENRANAGMKISLPMPHQDIKRRVGRIATVVDRVFGNTGRWTPMNGVRACFRVERQFVPPQNRGAVPATLGSNMGELGATSNTVFDMGAAPSQAAAPPGGRQRIPMSQRAQRRARPRNSTPAFLPNVTELQ